MSRWRRLSLAEDIDPRITGTDSQTSVEELEKLPRGSLMTQQRSSSCHHLNIDPKFPSHRQKRRPLNSEKYEALKEEVSKLLQSNFIREARYPKWVSNPVLLVDATAGHELLSFMDAYSRYNQIPMYPPDEEHTSFVTDKGLYCYRVMPFGLKNAGATYQRLVNKMFVRSAWVRLWRFTWMTCLSRV
ncbi:Protein kinase superfamily protein [Abeliophyllum distichum]|uniref:Protein kinase superfamily protein n=1 Tax=Abeliophyllum distichum TaxID=126358 RepID=A0ABD1V6Y1_9LAMI